MLTRYVWRGILLLSGVWLLPLLLIHAQPGDTSDLRAFLLPPEDCPAPCFMGIRPGVTDVETAVTILDEHPWVLWDDESPVSYRTPFQLSWQWSEAAPDLLDKQDIAFLALSNDEVGPLYLGTTITRAEVLLAFGKPDKYRLLSGSEVASGQAGLDYQYEAWYGDLGVMVLAEGECSATGTSYDWPVMLFVQAEPPDFAPGSRPPVTPCHQAAR